jgi:hypothetical protein
MEDDLLKSLLMAILIKLVEDLIDDVKWLLSRRDE